MRNVQAEFDSYTVFYTGVNMFRSLIVIPAGPHQEDIIVPHPVSVISRKDGGWTIKARNPRDTVTVYQNFCIAVNKAGGFDFLRFSA